MTAMEKFRAKFWAQIDDRTQRLARLLDDSRAGDERAITSLRELVHTMKGEAQLLTLDPAASLLERADGLLKSRDGTSLPEPAQTAMTSLRDALLELSRPAGAGEATERARRDLERAIAGGRGW